MDRERVNLRAFVNGKEIPVEPPVVIPVEDGWHEHPEGMFPVHEVGCQFEGDKRINFWCNPKCMFLNVDEAYDKLKAQGKLC
jgi:hypothetical protein